MQDLQTIFLFGIIFATLSISVTNNYHSFLRFYIVQVLCILGLFGVRYWGEMSSDLMLSASFGLAIVIRLYLIPKGVTHFINTYYVEKLKMRVTDRIFHFTQSTVFLILTGFFVLSYAVAKFVIGNAPELDLLLFATSAFVFLAGLLNFVNHRRLVGDILSFLGVENAIFLAGLLIITKLPIAIEIGIIVDVLLILLILLILGFNIGKIAGDTQVASLNELKD